MEMSARIPSLVVDWVLVGRGRVASRWATARAAPPTPRVTDHLRLYGCAARMRGPYRRNPRRAVARARHDHRAARAHAPGFGQRFMVVRDVETRPATRTAVPALATVVLVGTRPRALIAVTSDLPRAAPEALPALAKPAGWTRISTLPAVIGMLLRVTHSPLHSNSEPSHTQLR